MGRPPKEINMHRLNKAEIGYLIGLFIGDGSFCIDKKSRHCKVSFSLNPKRDTDIQKFLTDLLERIGLNPFVVFNNGSLDTRVNSKRLVEFVREELSEVNKNLENWEYFVGLLSGLIDSDGYANRKGIVVSMKNPVILKEVQHAGEKFSVRMYLRRGVQVYPPGSEIWRLRVSMGFKTTTHLSHKIRRIYGSGSSYPP